MNIEVPVTGKEITQEEMDQYRKTVIDNYRCSSFTILDIKEFSNYEKIPMVFEEFSKECRFDIYCFRKDYDIIHFFIEARKGAGVLFNLIPIDEEIEYTQQSLIEYRGDL